MDKRNTRCAKMESENQVRDSEYGSVTEGTTMGYLGAEAR